MYLITEVCVHFGPVKGVSSRIKAKEWTLFGGLVIVSTHRRTLAEKRQGRGNWKDKKVLCDSVPIFLMRVGHRSHASFLPCDTVTCSLPRLPFDLTVDLNLSIQRSCWHFIYFSPEILRDMGIGKPWEHFTLPGGHPTRLRTQIPSVS
jgi:hypothetical protein